MRSLVLTKLVMIQFHWNTGSFGCALTLLALVALLSPTLPAQDESDEQPIVVTPSEDAKPDANLPENDASESDKDKKGAKPKDKSDEDKPAEATPSDLIQLGEFRTEELILGVKITASTGMCKEIFATIPMPMEYPEQKVRVISSNFPATARYYLRPLTDTVQQLVITVPSMAPNSTLEATLRLEVQKAKILGPTDPEALVIPKKLARNLNQFMGPSPLIETNDAKIRKIAREIASTNPPNAWAHVEKIYDHVREAINYREGKAKSVLEALKDKEGDCEEMSGAFVAICRASKIPARCVWVHGHAYPEFYLEDKEGNGCWFPCQVAGTRQFGSMDEIRPILQKGDRFKVPEKTQPQRYVAEYLKVKSVVGGDGPDVEWIRNVK
jgi:hypothetical protein